LCPVAAKADLGASHGSNYRQSECSLMSQNLQRDMPTSSLFHKPWQLVACVEFADEKTAVRFERYLESGSGRAFAKRPFV
jgi:hypothetical protein